MPVCCTAPAVDTCVAVVAAVASAHRQQVNAVGVWWCRLLPVLRYCAAKQPVQARLALRLGIEGGSDLFEWLLCGHLWPVCLCHCIPLDRDREHIDLPTPYCGQPGTAIAPHQE